MTWGGLLFRDPMLSWMNVVKYTTRNKFLAFGGLNSKIDDSMVRKPIVLQRTGVDKISAIRFWGGVGVADIKNLYTPLAPQTRRTTEY